MKVIEFGQRLAEQYHVVLPVPDGNADSDAPFTTTEDNAARLMSYIDTHFDGQSTASPCISPTRATPSMSTAVKRAHLWMQALLRRICMWRTRTVFRFFCVENVPEVSGYRYMGSVTL